MSPLSQLPRCSGVCYVLGMHNLASSPYAAYKPPSNITTGTYDCRIHSRARICWCNYQYVRFPIRFVQPSYGTLPFPAAILRIVQINSLRCFVSLHSKQTQSRIPKISLPPLPPSAFHGTTRVRAEASPPVGIRLWDPLRGCCGRSGLL